MFEQEALSSGIATKRLWSTCLGLSGEVLLLACAALAPLVSPQVLPHRRALMEWLLPMAPPAPPPAGNAVKAHPARPPVERVQLKEGQIVAPVAIPPKAATIVDEPLESPGYGVPGGVGTGERNGVIGGMPNILIDVARPVIAVPAGEVAPTQAKSVSAKPKQVVPGGKVRMAQLIYRVEPQYPPLARQMRVSGTVELAGIIATDGHIRELKVRSGSPLLSAAALEAVRQWIYEPTLLDGEPVELIATISVIFRLN
jgi:protein TonB